MPNRIIKESICESRKLSEVSFFAEDLYKRLITYADDYGRFNADYQIILARLYPREIGIVSIDDIDDAMTELIGVGKIAFYTSEARKEIYGCFPKWAEHQRVRDSKKKCPEPDDTKVNDWYYRRFVSRDMKRKILERDKMKCKGCGKTLFADMESADRAIKFGGGLFHIDHIVPVNQGGRATEENLRLMCSSCNLRRKRHFTIEEIIEFSKNPASSDNLQKSAENCGELQKTPESSGLNPIQSESNPNTNTSSEPPKRFTPPTVEQVQGYCKERGNNIDPEYFIAYYENRDWKLSNGKKMKDWKLAVVTWEKNNFSKPQSPEKQQKTVVAQQYEQRDYSSPEPTMEEVLKTLQQNGLLGA